MDMHIYGLRAQDGVPVIDVLLRHYRNEDQQNLIEIARHQLNHQAQQGIMCDGIMLVIGDSAFVYSKHQLTL